MVLMVLCSDQVSPMCSGLFNLLKFLLTMFISLTVLTSSLLVLATRLLLIALPFRAVSKINFPIQGLYLRCPALKGGATHHP